MEEGESIGPFKSEKIYLNDDNEVLGIKLKHSGLNVPVIVFKMATVPQLFTWVDTPELTNRGLPHSLEHLLVGKGARPKFRLRERDMLLGKENIATYNDYVFFGLGSSGSLTSFYKMLDSLLSDGIL